MPISGDLSLFIFNYLVHHLIIPQLEERKITVTDRQLKSRAQRVAGAADWPAEWTEYFTGESDDQPSPKSRAAANQAPGSDPCKCSVFKLS